MTATTFNKAETSGVAERRMAEADVGRFVKFIIAGGASITFLVTPRADYTFGESAINRLRRAVR